MAPLNSMVPAITRQFCVTHLSVAKEFIACNKFWELVQMHYIQKLNKDQKYSNLYLNAMVITLLFVAFLNMFSPLFMSTSLVRIAALLDQNQDKL